MSSDLDDSAASDRSDADRRQSGSPRSSRASSPVRAESHSDDDERPTAVLRSSSVAGSSKVHSAGEVVAESRSQRPNAVPAWGSSPERVWNQQLDRGQGDEERHPEHSRAPRAGASTVEVATSLKVHARDGASGDGSVDEADEAPTADAHQQTNATTPVASEPEAARGNNAADVQSAVAADEPSSAVRSTGETPLSGDASQRSGGVGVGRLLGMGRVRGGVTGGVDDALRAEVQELREEVKELILELEDAEDR